MVLFHHLDFEVSPTTFRSFKDDRKARRDRDYPILFPLNIPFREDFAQFPNIKTKTLKQNFEIFKRNLLRQS